MRLKIELICFVLFFSLFLVNFKNFFFQIGNWIVMMRQGWIFNFFSGIDQNRKCLLILRFFFLVDLRYLKRFLKLRLQVTCIFLKLIKFESLFIFFFFFFYALIFRWNWKMKLRLRRDSKDLKKINLTIKFHRGI